MASSVAISIEEYLHNVYRPDCDYVDGDLIERNVGEFPHAMLQGILVRQFWDLAREVPIRVVPELRIRTGPKRFRIPDICVMRKTQAPESVLTHPPLLCIEILSPEDRMTRVMERVKEYLEFGVEHVWIVDPQTRTAYVRSGEIVQEVRDRLETTNPHISIDLAAMFAELDRESSTIEE